jgi:hypothetical protein
MLTNDEAGISGRTAETQRLTRYWQVTSFVLRLQGNGHFVQCLIDSSRRY